MPQVITELYKMKQSSNNTIRKCHRNLSYIHCKLFPCVLSLHTATKKILHLKEFIREIISSALKNTYWFYHHQLVAQVLIFKWWYYFRPCWQFGKHIMIFSWEYSVDMPEKEVLKCHFLLLGYCVPSTELSTLSPHCKKPLFSLM